jgi:pyrroline-5-carboxylate reductase
MKKILFIGGGKMMQAITGGLVRQGWGPDRIAAVEPNELAAIEVERLGCAVYRSAGDALGSLAEAGIIVLAVKPQVMRDALLPLTGKITSQQLVISIAAGLRVGDLLRWLDGGTGCMRSAQMVRAMPNTPALIQKGIAGLYAAPHLTAVGRSDAEQLMGAVGEVVWFEEESMLDAVTAVSGSGPAYVFCCARVGLFARCGAQICEANLLGLRTPCVCGRRITSDVAGQCDVAAWYHRGRNFSV